MNKWEKNPFFQIIFDFSETPESSQSFGHFYFSREPFDWTF